MNALIPVSKPGQLYAKMSTAIGTCYSINDCAGIATQAEAIAAYFKQVKDHDSVKKFLAIKVRAWRQIGLVFLTVDISACQTNGAILRKVRSHFEGDETVKEMSDTAVSNAMKLAKLPIDFFEQELEVDPNTYQIIQAYQKLMRQQYDASPEGQAEAARRQAEQEEWNRKQAEREEAEEAKRAKQEACLKAEAKRLQEERDQQFLDHQAMQAARDEVGYSMDRRDREAMKQILFLIKEPVHATLRQAAFDHRMTMQAVLRAGLAMWLIAHGYPFDSAELKLPLPPPTSPDARQ